MFKLLESELHLRTVDVSTIEVNAMNNLHRLSVGDIAPDFSLIGDQKQMVKLDDLVSGCGLILTFIHGTWCSACIQTIYRLRQYARTYVQKDFTVAIVASDSQSALRIFKLSAHPPVDFSLLDDEDGRVRTCYRLHQEGAYFIIDSKKIIREVFLDTDHQGWPGHSHILKALEFCENERGYSVKGGEKI